MPLYILDTSLEHFFDGQRPVDSGGLRLSYDPGKGDAEGFREWNQSARIGASTPVALTSIDPTAQQLI
ncbi:hypothetical protein [Halobellus litoreus]|uniref:Uncharacterized protein n=1 Tax=Halobellus litoreus TaxID=755310 RepID=A0ABD6DY99_9EURY|nr:hypothetical protein [Halobellus litoreus]